MKCLSVVLLGVIAGIVSCDMTCFNSESKRCEEEYGKYLTQSFDDYCRDQLPFMKCIKNTASKCETRFVKEAEEWYAVNVAACEEGSNLNKNIREYVDCVNNATSAANCPSNVRFELKDVSRDESECKGLRKMEECLYRKVKATCGKHAALVFAQMYHPMVRYQLKICDEYGHKN
ncbi:uncharacterized protein NPIL_283761 [Nephila pilipes]|uniref:Uncharacterized protein n=1 Tax=Nephila pilipes TaxID=299642 RepID=A0A8X6PVQ2_NEPPI|nr:uncharacterized protein NPIL_283761 [Nephila pilipes]